jgi:hypothetical protein
MQAIKARNYVTWPTLTPKTVRKHFTESVEVQKGHMKQQCQNIQSTKIKIEPDDKPIPDLETHVVISNNITNPPSFIKKQQRNQNSKTFSYASSMQTTPCTATNLDASWQHQARETNI